MPEQEPAALPGSAARLQLLHATPGRVRLRLAPEALDPELLRAVERTLAAPAWVHAVRVNPMARSVVVSYDPAAADLDAVLAAARRGGLDVAPVDVAEPGAPAPATRAQRTTAEHADEQAAGPLAGLRRAVPLVLGALAARDVLAGRLVSFPVFALAWYAVSRVRDAASDGGLLGGRRGRGPE